MGLKSLNKLHAKAGDLKSLGNDLSKINMKDNIGWIESKAKRTKTKENDKDQSLVKGPKMHHDCCIIF